MRTLGILLTISALGALPAWAQRTQLTVTGFPVVFAAPTPADLTAGSLTSATVTSFTVEALGGQPNARLTVVAIRCQVPCPAVGNKSPASLRWRRADLGTWNALTTTDVQIESRIITRGLALPASNNPWSNSLYWQALVGWTTDPPSNHTYNIVMTVTVTGL
jgi:hypothetical protein